MFQTVSTQCRGAIGLARQARQPAGNELPDRRRIVRHRQRHDMVQGRIHHGRIQRAERGAAHHHAKRTGPAGPDIGESVAVLVTRPAVAIGRKDRDVAQRRIDEQFPRGEVEG